MCRRLPEDDAGWRTKDVVPSTFPFFFAFCSSQLMLPNSWSLWSSLVVLYSFLHVLHSICLCLPDECVHILVLKAKLALAFSRCSHGTQLSDPGVSSSNWVRLLFWLPIAVRSEDSPQRPSRMIKEACSTFDPGLKRRRIVSSVPCPSSFDILAVVGHGRIEMTNNVSYPRC
ncbi:hypothetical protein FB446DRAFT_740268 [Lentinula raphanica]|nr:hypothetical protein FB446DRAFT_740268 [Lentinula raphanica]